jgi:hypothetical protein
MEMLALISAFAEEIQVTVPNIFQERAEAYVSALVKVAIYDVARLRKHATSLKAGSGKWFETAVDMHPFDAADIINENFDLIADTRSIAQIQASHGAHALVAWLKEHVPDAALPHKRQHIADALCANNITCTARLRMLAGRKDAVPWLMSMNIDKLDAEDVCAKISALLTDGVNSKEELTFPVAVPIAVPLALYDIEAFIVLLAADLQKLLPDMTAVAAHRCCETLFGNFIYTMPRFLRQLSLKSDKSAWLKELEWSEFDAADVLDIVEFHGGAMAPRSTLPFAGEPHGAAALVQWLAAHVPSLKLASKRQKYADALVANNVCTVHRMIVHANTEAWLVGIGFDQLDAVDCAAVLATLAKEDVLADVRAKRTAALQRAIAEAAAIAAGAAAEAARAAAAAEAARELREAERAEEFTTVHYVVIVCCCPLIFLVTLGACLREIFE